MHSIKEIISGNKKILFASFVEQNDTNKISRNKDILIMFFRNVMLKQI